MKYALAVVGGGPAGLSAARSYRLEGGQGPVRIVSADERPPYERPMLSKDYLRGDTELSEIALESQTFYDDHDIELTLGTGVDALDTSEHSMVLHTGEEVTYDSCVLATGGASAGLPVPGADHVLRLRSARSAEQLRDAAEHSSSALVIGSGFIGCEAAASLARRGIHVTVVSQEKLPQLDRLGHDAATRIEQWLADDGIRVIGGSEVSSIDHGHRVNLADHSSHEADLILLATGNSPASELAQKAQLPVNQGRVVVDERMRTSMPGHFAVGDIAFANNAAAGRRLKVEHWGEALRMGEIAGTVAAGGDDAWAQAPGFWTQIGGRILKYAAWGDGHDETELIQRPDGAFTVWYGYRGVLVGVLTHNSDDDYERGTTLVERGAPFEDVRRAQTFLD